MPLLGAGERELRIAETGTASISRAVNATVLRDPHRAEALSFPITPRVLLIGFGCRKPRGPRAPARGEGPRIGPDSLGHAS